jgi:hypothetical protein
MDEVEVAVRGALVDIGLLDMVGAVMLVLGGLGLAALLRSVKLEKFEPVLTVAGTYD